MNAMREFHGRPTLRVRILAALKLSPMTDAELARCLSSRSRHVAAVRASMLEQGDVWIVGNGNKPPRCGGPIPRVYAATQIAP